MTIRVALHHKTHYIFDRAINVSPHEVRLRPAAHCRTPIESYSFTVKPDKHFLNWQQDPYGNWLARLVFPEKTRELSITVDLVAEMTVINPFDFFIEQYAEQFPFSYTPENTRELSAYLDKEPAGKLLQAWIDDARKTILDKPIITIDFIIALNTRLQHDIKYLIRMEPGVQTPEETLESGMGSCRDSGWLLVQILRHFGHRGALCFGLPDPTRRRCKAVSMDPAAPTRTSPICTPGPKPTCPARAGSGSTRPPACWPAKAIFRSPVRPIPTSAAPVSGCTDVCESTLEFRDVGNAHSRRSARHQALQRCAVGSDPCAG